MHGDEIRARQGVVEAVSEFDLERARPAGGEVRVVGDHAHAEGNRAPGQFAADAAHAEDG